MELIGNSEVPWGGVFHSRPLPPYFRLLIAETEGHHLTRSRLMAPRSDSSQVTSPTFTPPQGTSELPINSNQASG